jgi:hypothetical protein
VGAASAANPHETYSLALTFDSSCNATVAFTWSNFPGGNHTVVVQLTDETTQGGDELIAYVSGGSGTVTHTWSISPSSTTDSFHAFAQLSSPNHILLRAQTQSQAQNCTAAP